MVCCCSRSSRRTCMSAKGTWLHSSKCLLVDIEIWTSYSFYMSRSSLLLLIYFQLLKNVKTILRAVCTRAAVHTGLGSWPFADPALQSDAGLRYSPTQRPVHVSVNDITVFIWHVVAVPHNHKTQMSGQLAMWSSVVKLCSCHYNTYYQLRIPTLKWILTYVNLNLRYMR